MNLQDIPIIDTHQHLWDLSRFGLPWLSDESVSSINRTFVMGDYLTAARDLNVSKTVYMEVNVHPSQQIREAEYVIDLCGRDDNPMAAAVIGGCPQSEEFGAMAERFAASPYVKGYRTVLHDADRPAAMCLQPQFVENMTLLGELGLHFELCMRPGEMVDAARLANLCPKTHFIVDHCGGMSAVSTDNGLRETWMKGMREMAARENTSCKISGIVASAAEHWQPEDLAPIVQFCLETFGEDRVCFGGDWPVCTLRSSLAQWVEALQWIVRDKSPEVIRKLFHDNAVRIYRLQTPGVPG